MYPARVSNPWQSVQNSRAGPANLKGDERGTLAFYGKNRLYVAADGRYRATVRGKLPQSLMA